VCKGEENARAPTIRKVTIAITYCQTKPRNSNVDIIRYDRKFPVRSIDWLIKRGKTPGKWNLLYWRDICIYITQQKTWRKMYSFIWILFLLDTLFKVEQLNILLWKELKYHAYIHTVFLFLTYFMHTVKNFVLNLIHFTCPNLATLILMLI